MIKRIMRIVGLTLIVSLVIARPLIAADDGPAFDPFYNTNNNIIFYDDPNASYGTCGGGTGAVAGGTGFAPTTAKLDNGTISRINALRSLYQKVSAQTKVAWEIYAAIDYRENDNNPNKSMLGGEPLGQPAVDTGLVPQTKEESIMMGSNELKGLAKGVYGINITSQMSFQELQSIFVAYNRGYAYKDAHQSPDTSPYVMNQYDAQHINMTFPSIPHETLAGQKETGRFGAMTIYSAIAGAAPGGSGACFGSGVGAKVDYSNIYPKLDAGTLTPDMLCIPFPEQPNFKLLKGPACDSFLAMAAAYKQTFGKQIPTYNGGGYRTKEEQIACGGTVQNPGGTNGACAAYNPKNDPPEHLWGTAIDFGGAINNTSSPEHKWLEANGPNFGWFWPNWAREGRGGNGNYVEPWHFAYYFVGHNPASDKLESYK